MALRISSTCTRSPSGSSQTGLPWRLARTTPATTSATHSSGLDGSWALRSEDAVFIDFDAAHVEHFAEVGRVDHVDLQEQSVGGSGDGVHAGLRGLLGVFGAVSGLSLVGDQGRAPSWASESVMSRRSAPGVD